MPVSVGVGVIGVVEGFGDLVDGLRFSGHSSSRGVDGHLGCRIFFGQLPPSLASALVDCKRLVQSDNWSALHRRLSSMKTKLRVGLWSLHRLPETPVLGYRGWSEIARAGVRCAGIIR